MATHSERLLALRKEQSLFVSQKRVKFSIIKPLFHTAYLYITLLLIVLTLFTSVGVSTLSTIQKTKNMIPQWQKALMTIKDFSPKSQKIQWNNLKQEMKETISPSLSPLGLDIFINNDIDRVIDTSILWYDAAIPLTNYSLNENGMVFIGPGTRYFTDDLSAFLSQAETLLPKSKQLLNSLWYYQLIGYLSFNSKVLQILTSINTLLDLVQSLIDHKDDLLNIIGHSIRKSYVILTQNNGEARPTGGFTGSYFSLEISKGLIDIKPSKSIYLLDDNKTTPIVTHPLISNFALTNDGQGVEGGFRNLNYFACYPQTAQMYQRELNNLGSNSIASDGIIMISNTLLLDLLPANFIFNVPGYGVFNSENIINEINRITSNVDPRPEDANNLKSALAPIFSVFLKALPKIIEQTGLIPFLNQVIISIETRNFQIWVANDFIQTLLHQFGLDGSKTCSNQNLISPLHINMTGDKRDSITNNRYAISTRPVWGGYEITVNYQQVLPPNTSLPRGFNEYYARQFFGLQIPSQSWDISIDSPTVYKSQPVNDFYMLNVKDKYGKDFTTPGEFEVIYNSISDLGTGYSYLQPDGTKVVATIFWANQKTSEVTVKFKIPAHYLQDIDFIGQPGINNPEVSLGNGVMFKEYTEKVVNDRFAIQKGITLITL